MFKQFFNRHKKEEELKKQELIELQKKAYDIAFTAHTGQVDKAGKDYFNEHILFVTNAVKTPEEKIVALLHDTIEDTHVTLEYLRLKDFPEYIIEAVDAITRRKNESYDTFIKRVALNPIAKEVKIADLKHNSDLNRLSNITQEDLNRTQKYQHYLLYLENYLKDI